MNDVADLPGLPPRHGEALANGTLGDPFAVLGPHDTATGRIVRAFLPGAQAVEVLARDGGTVARAARADRAARAVRGPREQRTSLICCASPGRARCRRPRIPIPSARCWANSICICSTKGGISNSPSHLGANVATIDGVAACGSRSGRRMRARYRWSVISIPGIRGATRCGCAIRPACGSCSSRVSVPGARYKFAIVGPDGCASAAQGRSAGACDRAAAGHRVRRRGSHAARLARRRPGCSSVRRRHAADAPITIYEMHAASWFHPEDASRPGMNWRNGWCPMSARWASPISS